MEGRFLAEPLKATTVTCIPRLRGGARRPRRAASSAGAPPPVSSSVLDRVRDVVLRLAMLSAASTKGALPPQQQAAIKTSPGRSAAPTPSRRAAAARMSPSSAYADSYRSEAVDECIEFLKRSAAGAGSVPAATTVGVANSPSPLHACAM
uniref:Uncharacterized protein n=1 Tax=Leersia perrieri TaxID=77586 RepID=A0A0D9W1V0_9ORYZ